MRAEDTATWWTCPTPRGVGVAGILDEQIADYPLPELMEIARLMLDRRAYGFTSAAGRALEAHLEEEMERPGFANTRTVRNALDHARMRQALRLFRLAQRRGELSREELATVDAKDIGVSAEPLAEAVSATGA
ncbi:MAG: hypothetical protein ACRDJ4_02330 [Actinomycetota bacterium]